MIDENKLKLLLLETVNDIFSCLPVNTFTANEKSDIISRVNSSDLQENGIKLPTADLTKTDDPDFDLKPQLRALIARWRQYQNSHVYRKCADDLETLLKEYPE